MDHDKMERSDSRTLPGEEQVTGIGSGGGSGGGKVEVIGPKQLYCCRSRAVSSKI